MPPFLFKILAIVVGIIIWKTVASSFAKAKKAMQDDEDEPEDDGRIALADAIEGGKILFYGAFDGAKLVGCCSVCPTYSTFNYARGGVFEDFYVLPEYRHKGVARGLVRFAFAESGVASLTVGCADCDVAMYEALGFGVRLGNMLAYNG